MLSGLSFGMRTWVYRICSASTGAVSRATELLLQMLQTLPLLRLLGQLTLRIMTYSRRPACPRRPTCPIWHRILEDVFPDLGYILEKWWFLSVPDPTWVLDYEGYIIFVRLCRDQAFVFGHGDSARKAAV